MDGNGALIGLTLALIFMASSAYAMALQTRPGKRLATEKTHFSVIIGTALVVAPLLIVLDFADWMIIVAAFLVASIPIVARSEINDLQDRDAARKALDDDETDD